MAGALRRRRNALLLLLLLTTLQRCRSLISRRACLPPSRRSPARQLRPNLDPAAAPCAAPPPCRARLAAKPLLAKALNEGTSLSRPGPPSRKEPSAVEPTYCKGAARLMPPRGSRGAACAASALTCVATIATSEASTWSPGLLVEDALLLLLCARQLASRPEQGRLTGRGIVRQRADV